MSNVIIVANKVTLKGIVDMVFLETRFSVNNPFRTPLPSSFTERVAKGGIGLMSVGQGNPLPSGNSMRGLLQALVPNPVQSFPVVKESPSQSN